MIPYRFHLFAFLFLWLFLKNGMCKEVPPENRKNVVCYHGTWATYRKSLGKFDVAQIDPFLCTHLMYAFFGIEEDGSLRIIDPYLDLEDNWGRGNVREFNALKLQNPTLKTLAAVGGWNEGSKNFSIVANNPHKRARFIRSIVQFIQRHGFDGLDLDWEYPNQRHDLSNDDKSNFTTFLRELKEGLDPFGYMLTAAVGSTELSAKLSYDIPEVLKYIDFVNIMAYDLHGPWENVTGINAPLFAADRDHTTQAKQYNVNAIVQYWISQGAPSEKLVLGVPFYGRSFTLKNATQNTPGAPHFGKGLAGQYSVEPGVIGYNELCERFQHENWTIEWEEQQMVPYAYLQHQWVGFENMRSIELKAKYVKDHNLGGIMVWSLESDDFLGRCGKQKYPLLTRINTVLFGTTTPTGLIQAAFFPQTDYIQEKQNTICQEQIGYVVDKKNCSNFFYCDGQGQSYNFICPPGLKFDLSSSSCSYSQKINC